MMDEIKNIIKNDAFLLKIRNELEKTQCEAFLVGGYIRNCAIKKEGGCDRDIVLFNCDAEYISKQIADNMGGAFVELDSENKIYRVVLEEDYTDIAQGLNNNIDDDIKRRDFTINSIFYNLKTGDFIDIAGGFQDIKNGIIKSYDIKNLEDDPLRILRAYRFKSELNFKINEDILDFIQKNAKSLDTIAKERINQEILKMFDGEFLPETLLEMHDTGLLEIVFPFIQSIKKIPSNSHHHLDLVHHSIETVKQIRSTKAILRLAAFYHDIGKPYCWTIEEDTGRHRFIGHDEKGGEIVKKELSDLKFSKKQIEYVSKMVKHHIYPSSLMSTPEGASNKAMARFVRKIHPDVEDLIEIARADRLSARGEAVSDNMVYENLEKLDILLNYYQNIKDTLKEMPKLLDGREIMEILNIKAGPRLGEIIDELKEGQIAGSIKTKEDAICFIKGLA